MSLRATSSLKVSFLMPFYLLFLLRSCFTWFFVPGGGPLRWEWLVIDYWIFGDDWHWCVTPVGALVDTGALRMTHGAVGLIEGNGVDDASTLGSLPGSTP